MVRSQFAGKRVLAAVPAFNEEESVGGVIEQIRECFPEVDVLVIDDGSTDCTARVASQAGALVCRLPCNLGVGGAMRAAYKFAVRSGYDVVVQIDADGQHDPTTLALLIEKLDTADLVIGARFAGVGSYDVPVLRRLAMRFLSGVFTRLSRTRLTDVTSGYRAAGPRAISLFAVHYPAEYLGDTVESLVIALRTGLRVQQVPVAMQHRRVGRPSQSSLRAGVYLGRAAAALALALVRQWPVSEEDSAVVEALRASP